jgi:hypothetical protein
VPHIFRRKTRLCDDGMGETQVSPTSRIQPRRRGGAKEDAKKKKNGLATASPFLLALGVLSGQKADCPRRAPRTRRGREEMQIARADEKGGEPRVVSRHSSSRLSSRPWRLRGGIRRSAILTDRSGSFVRLPCLLAVHCPGTPRLLHRWVRYPNKRDLASWHLGFLRFWAENEVLRGEVPNSTWHPGLLAPA